MNKLPTNKFAAETFLGKRIARNVKGKRGTQIVRVDGGIAARYHGVSVVTWLDDGSVKLYASGYRSATTKRRINQFTPNGVGVYQEAFQWYLTASGEDAPVPFREGVKLAPGEDGRIKIVG